MAIIDYFDRGWRSNPHGVAYIMDDTSFTFSEIGELSCRIANGLVAAGLPKETKGAVWAANHPVAWACTLGIWRAGLAWIPINPRNSLDENSFLLESFDAEVVFFQSCFAATIEAVKGKLPGVRLWVSIDGEVADAVLLAGFVAQHPVTAPDITYDMDDVVAIMPTGGTTGMPKGVMNSHRSIQTFVANFMIGVAYRNDERPVNLAAAPMTHTAGVLSLPCTARGGIVVVLTRPDPAALFDAITRHRVTELFLPPTVIYRLLEMPDVERIDFSSLRYIMYGAAPMSVAKLKQAITLFGPVMMGGYGQSECPASISFLRPEEHFAGNGFADDVRLSSVGRPCPLNNVAILGDNNRNLSTGETGEICVRGDLVMKGYYKAPDKTAETIVDGWLHTGDVGHMDGEGYLYITDRKKDMIISGGFNVYPSEVEQVIWEHPAVQDCAVIGVPDSLWGEAVKAVVELKPGMRVDGLELIELCKERLGSVKAPKTVDIIEILPRSANGKVLKKDLRARYWEGESRKI